MRIYNCTADRDLPGQVKDLDWKFNWHCIAQYFREHVLAASTGLRPAALCNCAVIPCCGALDQQHRTARRQSQAFIGTWIARPPTGSQY